MAIGIHILIVLGLVAGVHVDRGSKSSGLTEVVFIFEQSAIPSTSKQVGITPEIESPVTLDAPPPEVQFDERVDPLAETMPAAEMVSSAATTPAIVQDLRLLKRVEPSYPAESRRDEETGTAILKVLVDEQGIPRAFQVARSSGYESLDRAAIDTVKQWRFAAATDGTRTISVWCHVAVSFDLVEHAAP